MKLLWHNYLVLNLGNCMMKSFTETGLRDLYCIGANNIANASVIALITLLAHVILVEKPTFILTV